MSVMVMASSLRPPLITRLSAGGTPRLRPSDPYVLRLRPRFERTRDGFYDRAHPGVGACGRRPNEFEFACSTPRSDIEPFDFLEAEPGSLQERRDRGAYDILAGVGPARVTGCKKRRQPVAAVSGDRYFDQSAS